MASLRTGRPRSLSSGPLTASTPISSAAASTLAIFAWRSILAGISHQGSDTKWSWNVAAGSAHAFGTLAFCPQTDRMSSNPTPAPLHARLSAMPHVVQDQILEYLAKESPLYTHASIDASGMTASCPRTENTTSNDTPTSDPSRFCALPPEIQYEIIRHLARDWPLSWIILRRAHPHFRTPILPADVLGINWSPGDLLTADRDHPYLIPAEHYLCHCCLRTLPCWKFAKYYQHRFKVPMGMLSSARRCRECSRDYRSTMGCQPKQPKQFNQDNQYNIYNQYRQHFVKTLTGVSPGKTVPWVTTTPNTPNTHLLALAWMSGCSTCLFPTAQRPFPYNVSLPALPLD